MMESIFAEYIVVMKLSMKTAAYNTSTVLFSAMPNLMQARNLRINR